MKLNKGSAVGLMPLSLGQVDALCHVGLDSCYLALDANARARL